MADLYELKISAEGVATDADGRVLDADGQPIEPDTTEEDEDDQPPVGKEVSPE